MNLMYFVFVRGPLGSVDGGGVGVGDDIEDTQVEYFSQTYT